MECTSVIFSPIAEYNPATFVDASSFSFASRSNDRMALSLAKSFSVTR